MDLGPRVGADGPASDQEPPAGALQKLGPGEQTRPMRILLVDDDPDIRLLAGLELRKDGHDVAEAADGEEAVYRAATERPDVIVLDLMMPRRDGYSVLEELQIVPETEDIPVIVLSVRNSERDKVQVLDAGADDYVTKPFGLEELLARIRATTRRAGGQDPRPPVLRFGRLVLSADPRKRG